MERKVCFISDGGNWGLGKGKFADVCPKADYPPATVLNKQGVRAFKDRVGWGLCVETAQSSLTVLFKFVISGLTSIILIVLGTVNLQLQGPFVPISLWSVLRIKAAHVLGTVWS